MADLTLPGFTATSSRRTSLRVSPVLALFAPDAFASFGGNLGFDPEFFFFAAMIMSIPGGIICLISELIGAKRQPSMWLGVFALGLGVFALACVMFVRPRRIEGVIAMFLLPPFMTLALVSLLRAPTWRVAVAWLVILGSIGLIVAARAPLGTPDQARELAAGLFGGALTHIILWHFGFALGQRNRRRAGIAPPPGPDVRVMLCRAAVAWRDKRPEKFPIPRVHPGFWWWIGGTTVFFVAMMVVAPRLDPTLLRAVIVKCQQIHSLLGLPFTIGFEQSLTARPDSNDLLEKRETP